MLLEVGHEPPLVGVDAEEVVHVDVGGLGLGPALGDQRDRARDAAGARAVPTPAPVRRNHSSSVKLVAPSAGAAPNVTYWLEPFNCRAVPAFADGVADTVAEAAEAWAAVSTATTT